MTRLSSAETRSALPSAFLLFLGLGVIVHLDQFLGPYGFVDFYDTIEVHFSHFQNMAKLFLEYGVFSWYPFHGGGVPAFVGQHPPYHPAVLLSAALPIWLLSLLWNIAMTTLAGWGMWRLLLRLADVSTQASLFMGALYGLSVINGNVHIVFGYAFPAFAVLTLEAFEPGRRRAGRFARCAGLVLTAMFSFPVLTLPHFPIFHLAMVLCLGWKRPDLKRQVAGVFLVWTGYVLLFVPSIASLYLYIPYAQRDWNFQPVGLGKAVVSLLAAVKNHFIELPVFPLLLPSLYLLRKQRRASILFGLILASLFLAAIFGSDMKNFLANTFVVKMDLFLFAMLATPAACILAALGMDVLRWETGPIWKIFSFALICLLFRKPENAIISGVFATLAVMLMVEFLRQQAGLRPTRRTILLVALLALCFTGYGIMTRQQYMSSGSYFPYPPFATMKPLAALAEEAEKEPFRVGCIDIHPAIVQAYGLDTVGGKSPLFNGFYKDYVKEAVAPQLTTPALRDGFGSTWRQLYLTRTQADHDQRPLVLAGPERSARDFDLPMLQALGVRYLVSARPLIGFEGLADLVYSGAGEGPTLPTFVQKTELGRMYSLQIYLYKLRQTNSLGFLAQRDQARPDGLWMRADAQLGTVRLVSWAPDKLTFEGTALSPTNLVVSNNFDPRWKATLNDQVVPILQTNRAFQSFAIAQPGPFRAVLEFHSPLVWWLHVASLLGIGLMFGSVALSFSQPSRGVSHDFRFPAWRLRSRYLGPCLLAGSLLALVWLVGFMFFVLPKAPHESAQSLTMAYALWTIPLLGPCIGGWTAWFTSTVS